MMYPRESQWAQVLALSLLLYFWKEFRVGCQPSCVNACYSIPVCALRKRSNERGKMLSKGAQGAKFLK
jgi:hypothetical protein